MAIEQGRKPRRAGGYVRISEDPTGLERGVTRQREDVEELAARQGWQLAKVYEENDTSAYKKKRVVLADGRSVWRVVRPQFAQMLKDYEDGVIDGIIVYDLDRLARQPRDLEDLIDLVEHHRRPVTGVTGALDLMSENGKAMARVLVAMANKASADTARRVARERLQRAQTGTSLPPVRPFGWREDRVSLEPAEAAVLRRAVKRFTAGESWAGVLRQVAAESSTVSGKPWYLATLKNAMLNPRVAGIAVYGGSLRTAAGPADEEGNGDGPGQADAGEQSRTGERRAMTSPRDLAVRDAQGGYVRGSWKPVVSVEKWEAMIAEFERRREGREFTTRNTRRYLLSGLLRCGKPGKDGTLCNKTLVGVANRRRKDGPVVPIYKCPGPVNGGCGGTQRNMAQVDALIEDLLFLHLETNRPADDGPEPGPEPDDAALAGLEEIRSGLARMRTGMRDGTVSAESFFAVVPGLEAREKKLAADLASARSTRSARVSLLRSKEEIRAEWDAPDTTIAGRRALLGQYLMAVSVHPARRVGPGAFDHTTIEPVWKPMP